MRLQGQRLCSCKESQPVAVGCSGPYPILLFLSLPHGSHQSPLLKPGEAVLFTEVCVCVSSRDREKPERRAPSWLRSFSALDRGHRLLWWDYKSVAINLQPSLLHHRHCLNHLDFNFIRDVILSSKQLSLNIACLFLKKGTINLTALISGLV